METGFSTSCHVTPPLALCSVSCAAVKRRVMETRQRTQPPPESPEEGSSSSTIPADLAERRRAAQGCLQRLSQHSYWFDLWIFLLFDLVLLVFIYLLP